MESMSIQIFNLDFSPAPPQPLDMRVERLTWKARGGPAAAWISGHTLAAGWGIQAAQWAQDALRRPLEIVDQAGEKAWWGYIHRVEVRHAGFSLVYDLSKLANRVCVEYWQREAQLEWTGVKTFTPWADDLDSQRRYGVKERVFRLGSMDELEALQAHGTLLADHCWPRPHLTGSPPTDKGVEVHLECRGWWDTLTWKTAHFNDGYEGYVRPAQIAQYLGRTTTMDARIGQSFKTAYGGWKLGEAVVNLRGIGLNADGVRCELCADANGTPGSALDSAEVSAAVIGGARWWVRFVFSQRVQIDADTVYWLVFSRTGILNTSNYYQLYLDNTNSFLNGKLVIWNGTGWQDSNNGQADINFYVVGYVTRLERLKEMTGAGMGGQFLSGVQVNTGVSGDTMLWREGILNCGEEVVNLLESGTDGSQLSARVDSSRRLVVSEMPGEGEWLFSINGAGQLRARSGRMAVSSDQPAGQRLMLANGWEEHSVIIEELEWTREAGLQVKWNIT